MKLRVESTVKGTFKNKNECTEGERMNAHEDEDRITTPTPPRTHFDIERAGQLDFFNRYHVNYHEDKSVLDDDTDGVWHGNIMEFKLNISNTGSVLFQVIKYLSKMRVKGKSIPMRILLIDINATRIYVYNSIDYIDDIQKVYVGAASRDNDAFAGNITPVAEYNYTDDVDSSAVRKLLINKVKNETDWYIPIDIDENCIVGWAERYYREVPKATKGDFLGDGTGQINQEGEIRDPKHFKGLINPYPEKTNKKFAYLMDCLNSRLAKKDLGAFFTPLIYAKKAGNELVMKAVERVPEGNDYIILDRCAETGALEVALIGLKDKNGDELISHCVVSTYEYYEYKVLLERIGDLVRDVIPPTEANVVYENGVISNADAMSKEYIDNPLIRQYVDNPKCTIILFENPPYRDASAANKKNEKNSKTKQSYITEQMSKVKDTFANTNTSTVRDLTNQFVWSGVSYYLRQATDSYVLFSPVKWWKSCGIVSLTMNKGYLFNRQLFHAGASAISCCLWFNVADNATETITLEAYETSDTDNGEKVDISKCWKSFSEYYQKNINGVETSVFCESDGTEAKGRKCDGKSVYADDVICYLTPKGFTLDANNNNLVRMTHYNNRGTYAVRTNYLAMLPLFVAKEYPRDKFYEKGEGCIYFTTSDGGDAYTKDKTFLKSCLIYTCLSNQNKCLSFTGSDGRYYRNELCFDTTHGDTVASADLAKMILDADEKALIELWNRILEEAKKTVNYDSRLTYGVYQITEELNTSHKEGSGTTEKTVYDYPILNSYRVTLRDNLKEYYKSHITDKMFKYELLK